jgi:hypothetical protein
LLIPSVRFDDGPTRMPVPQQRQMRLGIGRREL